MSSRFFLLNISADSSGAVVSYCQKSVLWDVLFQHKQNQDHVPLYLYPRHLCQGVYSFRLSVCMFVRSFVRSFVLPSVAWNLRQSFALKFLKWCISQQLLIRKHSYLDHSYPVGLAFIP